MDANTERTSVEKPVEERAVNKDARGDLLIVRRVVFMENKKGGNDDKRSRSIGACPDYASLLAAGGEFRLRS